MTNITKSIVASVLTAAFVGPVTWAFSQQSIARDYGGQMNNVVLRVEKHDLMLAETKTAIERSDKANDARIANITKLWEAQLQSEKELILLVREQNTINTKLLEQLLRK